MSFVTALLLVLGATPSPTAPAPTQEAFTCLVTMEMEGLEGWLRRQFLPSSPGEYYEIHLRDVAAQYGPSVSWMVDNRPLPRRIPYDYVRGRPEADAFRLGPDLISFGEIEHPGIADGRIWVRLFGDGVYAGAVRQQSARRTRQAHRRGERRLSVALSQRRDPEIVAALANARQWRAVLVDESGRMLGERTIIVPTAERAREGFEQARQALLANRDAFLAGRLSNTANAPCQIDPEPVI